MLLPVDRRLRRLGVLMGLMCLAVVCRLAWVQLIHRERYENPTHIGYHRKSELLAQKGVLLDRVGRPLARCKQVASIAANPQLVADPAAVARRLAPLLQMDVDELEGKLRDRWRKVLLRRELPQPLIDRLQPLADAGILSFGEVEAEPSFRLYVFPRQFQPTPSERHELAMILGIRSAELDTLLASEAGAIRLQEDLDASTAMRISGLDLAGLVVQANPTQKVVAAWLEPTSAAVEERPVEPQHPGSRGADWVPVIRPEVWQAMQPIFDGGEMPDPERVADRLRAPFVYLVREVPLEIGDAVAEVLKNEPGLDGISVHHEWAREYPQGDVARLLIGGSDVDERGYSGLEGLCNQILTGVDGYRKVTVSALGQPIVQEREELVPPAHGKNVELSIDVVIQGYAEDALRQAVSENDADWGLAVVIDPLTGEVLAMADVSSERRQTATMMRCMMTAYEPGSVIKPLVVAAALEAGLTTPDEMFYCGGTTKIGSATLHCIKVHGPESVADAVRDSCNMVMIKLAERLRQHGLEAAFKSYGLLGRTGLGLADQEASGAIFERGGRGWSPQKVATVSYGKGIQCTAVGLVRAYASLLNGGTLPQLNLVRRILDREGNLLVEQPLETGPRLISESTAAEVRTMLRRTVADKHGTGHLASSDLFDLAGKTGTSLGYRSDDPRIVSFIGYAPSDNPRLLCLVSIAGPRNGMRWGSTTCGPPVRSILEQSLQYLGIAPHVPPPAKDGAS